MAEPFNNLAVTLKQKGELEQALAACRRAIAIAPKFAAAHRNLGNILLQQRKEDAAIDSYREAIALDPRDLPALQSLAELLGKTKSRDEESIGLYRRVLELSPDCAEAHNNLGLLLSRCGEYDEAVVSLRRAIDLKPGIPQSLSNLGIALVGKREFDAAIEMLRVALQQRSDPMGWSAYTYLFFALYHHPDVDAQKLLKESVTWAKEQPVFPSEKRLQRNRDPDRKLKVGYVSSAFFNCADAHFILPLLSNHDRTKFEITAFSSRAEEDNITAQLKPLCDHWVNIDALGVADAVALIRRHELDILVSISPPADKCRKFFASRMAPVQMTWLMFASCTTGLPAMDYRISDPYVDPPELGDAFSSEKIIRLPETAWAFGPLCEAGPIVPPPALANGYITFGSLNRFIKINAKVIQIWAKVLCTVPNSRLILLAIAGEARQRVLNEFAAHGVQAGQIEFVDRMSRAKYLQTYERIDITLDTFPFSGHTTALDSLWMGVPVVTLLGNTPVGRVAASALTNLQLENLIAHTPEQYVEIAVQLANDVSQLSHLRSILRNHMEKSPLMDGRRFARNLESVYVQKWQEWCSSATAE
jgi:predicted O-linked N-acetylglucosamine transferase (SPINDLY family)